MPNGAVGPVIRLAATFGAFILGMYGFAAVYGEAGVSALAGYAYKSLQLIVGQFPEELVDRPLPLSLQIARWALPLLTFWATATLAWTNARNPLRLHLNRLRGDHLIVAGDAGVAARVVSGERRAKRPVIVWAASRHEDWVAAAGDEGAPHLLTDGSRRGAAKLGLDKARSLLVAGSDDGANIALAGVAMEEALATRPPGDPLLIIARVDDLDLRAPLERRFDWTGERTVARVRFASLPEIVARQLFKGLLLDRFYAAKDSPRRVYLIGFSSTAERYALKLLAGAHFRDGGKAELVVLDPDAERKREVFFARRPGAAALANVIFEVAPTDQPALIGRTLERVMAAHGPPSAMIVDPMDETRALALALAIDDFYRHRGEISPPIHVHLAAGGPDDDLGCAIAPFGELRDLADPELLLQERLDDLARASHEFYFESRLDEGDQVGSRISMYEWDLLPEAVRDDNRLAADCYELKLRDIGARLLPDTGQGESLQFRPDEIEELSRAEHDRWMAAKLIDGWRFGEARDDAAKLHPDIVPYDDLSEARRDLDREQVRVITRLVSSAGLRAVRDLIVLVEGDGTTPLALTPALEALREHYPDRALVLLGAFEDPTVRAAFATAPADAVWLTVSVDPEKTLAGRPRESRPASRKLYRRADRLYARPVGTPAPSGPGWARERADIRITLADDGTPAPPTVIIKAEGPIAGAPWTR